MYACVGVWVYGCMYVCMCGCMYVCVGVWVYVCMHVCMLVFEGDLTDILLCEPFVVW